MFKPTNFLHESLAERNRKHIVGALIGYINADPAFETDDFDNAVQYALKHGITENELFQSYDNTENEIETDRLKWDEAYYALAKVYLNINFCQKRIGHVKEVAHYLYPNGFKKQTTQIADNHVPLSPNKQQPSSNNTRKKASDQRSWLPIIIICLAALILGIYWVLKK